MKYNKGMTSIQVLIFLALGVFAFVIIASIFSGQFGKSTNEVNNLLSASKDYDGDGVMDFFDKCACSPGKEEFSGCNTEEEQTQNSQQIKECRKKIDDAYT